MFRKNMPINRRPPFSCLCVKTSKGFTSSHEDNELTPRDGAGTTPPHHHHHLLIILLLVWVSLLLQTSFALSSYSYIPSSPTPCKPREEGMIFSCLSVCAVCSFAPRGGDGCGGSIATKPQQQHNNKKKNEAHLNLILLIQPQQTSFSVWQLSCHH